MAEARSDGWKAGESYERYMGRWSRRIADGFLDWLEPPEGQAWLDVGCGTGALARAILERCRPRTVLGIDPSAVFVAHAAAGQDDPRAQFRVGDAQSLPLPPESVDIVVSALALNFVPDRVAALAEMRRVARPGGRIAFYVWDYPGGGMGFIDAFWKAAASLDPAAAAHDEAARFPFCTAADLRALAEQSGLAAIEVRGIETVTDFPSFEDLWQPFTLGAGPAPAYCAGLDEAGRQALRERLRQRLGGDGPVALPARAWAVTGARAAG